MSYAMNNGVILQGSGHLTAHFLVVIPAFCWFSKYTGRNMSIKSFVTYLAYLNLDITLQLTVINFDT